MDFYELEKYLAGTHSLMTSSRQMGKSMTYATAYGAGGHAKPEWTDPYTQDQYDAFAAAIAGLSDQHPVVGRNRTARKKIKARATAAHFAKMGSPENATAQAVYGGIPKAALAAVRALIFS